jgi:predicted N-acetyltransferase YhbS
MDGLVGIGRADRAAQHAWCDYVRAVFRHADFARWIEWGCWNDDYRTFAWFEGGTVVAAASATRMRLLVGARPIAGWQLGAVGCRPPHRGRGLARRVVQAALAYCGGDPVLLFGNPSVVDFYPRFGFVPCASHVFEATHRVEPAGAPAPRLDVADPVVRARLDRLCADGVPMSTRFGATGFGKVVAWYHANGFARPLRALDDGLWIAAGVEGDTLHVDGVFATAPRELAPLLPRLVDQPVSRLRFGFSPEQWWPGPVSAVEDADAFLFLRGFDPPPPTPHGFPPLART